MYRLFGRVCRAHLGVHQTLLLRTARSSVQMAARARTPSPIRPSGFVLGAVRAVIRQVPTARQAPATVVSYISLSICEMQRNLFCAGLVCTDGGITSGVILSEYGYADFGANYGGERTSVCLCCYAKVWIHYLPY